MHRDYEGIRTPEINKNFKLRLSTPLIMILQFIMLQCISGHCTGIDSNFGSLWVVWTLLLSRQPLIGVDGYWHHSNHDVHFFNPSSIKVATYWRRWGAGDTEILFNAGE